ncbi:hypothetical protein UZ36_07275 [Candidatus Nitromaritima sp. SCGC AAA799-C22]|nr:hypothetical protein UZ36_07275 [Candidatus Nitromaritima sp. SCGC AAA799-C22]
MPTYVTDNNGNEFRLEDGSSIRATKHPHMPLKVRPAFPATVTLKFKGKGKWEVGTVFSLTSNQAILATNEKGNLKKNKDDRYLSDNSFNLSIRNIKVKK